MKLLKLRFGPATNSSSSHSIVIWKNGPLPRNEDDYASEYGWDNFTLVSKKSKKNYLDVVRRDLGIGPDVEGYIDHGSSWGMPTDAFTGEPCHEGLEALLKFIEDTDNCIILGGNDNSDGHPLEEDAIKFAPASLLGDYGNVVMRKDPKGFWTILRSSEYGPVIKARFGEEATKATTPELVDIKITDFCAKGCAFCYQGSTTKGARASKETLVKAVDTLSALGVMEVAIGGGEPSTHPDLEFFLQELRSCRIIPNVTTRDYAWAKKQKLISAGNLGISIGPGFKDFISYATHHVVMGTLSREQFRELLTNGNGKSFLLLAPKTPKGAFEFQPFSWWMQEVWTLQQSINWWGRIGIDTPLAAMFEKELKGANIDTRLYETEEGKFSCYWDLVEGKIAPSSYNGENESFTSFDASEFTEKFAKW
jgi:hypothetical protein